MASVFLPLWDGGCDHPEPVFRFSRFPLAQADSISKLLLRARVIRFAVIRTDAGRRLDKLLNEWRGNGTNRQLLGKRDHALTKTSGSLLQIKLSSSTVTVRV